MAFQATADGCKLVLKFKSDIGTWSNHLWFSKADFITSEMLALGTLIKAHLVDELVDSMALNAVLDDVYAYDMRTIDGPIAVATGGDGTGDQTGEELPLSLAVVCSLYTAKRGRSHRGRIYFAGFCENQIEDGEWASALTGDVFTAVYGIVAEAGSIGWVFGVRSGQLDGVKRDPAIITPITFMSVRNAIPGHQRRRAKRP